MTRLYINKTDYFKNKKIPLNDFEIWNSHRYIKYLHLHDKFKLSQKLAYPCGLIKIDEQTSIKNFPLYIRPRINKEGMGYNSFRANNKFELYNNLNILLLNKNINSINEEISKFFWVPYICPNKPIKEKIHLSYDLVLIEGTCVFQCIFRGHKLNDIEFSHWELVNEPIYMNNQYIMQILKDDLKDFSGIVNFEILEGFIIEIHLRMGDIYHLPKIGPYIQEFYQSYQWNYSLDLQSMEIYLFTVWGSVKQAQSLQKDSESLDKIWKILEPTKYYQFLTEFMNHQRIRIFFYKIYNYQQGLKIQQQLYYLLEKYN